MLLRPTLAFASLFLLFFSPLCAQSEPYVPPGLNEWVPWVLEGMPDRGCTVVQDVRRCWWPSSLRITADDSGGGFELHQHLERRGTVVLPGGGKVWPSRISVSISGQADRDVAVREESGQPTIVLEPGDYIINGKFLWTTIPESIRIPADAGQIKLTVSDAERPVKITNGALWIRSSKPEPVVEENRLDVSTYRKIVDDIPFTVETLIKLSASGLPREVSLGSVTLADDQVTDITSSLPFRYNTPGDLVLQVRPGQHTVTIRSVFGTPPAKLTFPQKHAASWPEEELWAWIANPVLRSVEISGAPTVDVSQTDAPPEWNGSPVYLIHPDTTLEFAELRRGETNPAVNTLTLQRTAWLDLDGSGLTIHDQLQGTLNERWRLSAAEGLTLGRVQTNGVDQLITLDPASKLPGVELRSQSVSVQAESRITDAAATLPAVGWDQRAESLHWVLNLPPGWSLFGAKGPDSVPGGWIEEWSLLELFMTMLLVVTTAKVVNRKTALLTLLLVVLTHTQFAAPRFSWFHLLIALAITRVLREGALRLVSFAYLGLSIALVALQVGQYAYAQILTALFPHLSLDGVAIQAEFRTIIPRIMGGVFTVGIMLCALAFVIFLFTAQWKRLRNTIFIGLGLGLSTALVTCMDSMIESRPTYDGQYQAATLSAPAPQSAEYLEQEVSKSVELPLRRQRGREMDDAAVSGFAKSDAPKRKALQQVDPNAAIQTGPGLPNWQGTPWQLVWSGPVDTDQTVSLILISPSMNLILAFLRTALAVGLLLCFLLRARAVLLPRVALILLLPLLWCADVRAEPRASDGLPSPEILRELGKRLVADQCQSQCASILHTDLQLSADTMQLSLTVGSQDTGSVALPGPADRVQFDTLKLDGSPAILRRDENGFLWARIPNGVHTLIGTAKLSRARSTTLQFPSAPHTVTTTKGDWTIDESGNFGSSGYSLELIPPVSHDTAAAASTAQETAPQLDPWYIVHRSLTIGINWEIETSVERLGPTDRSQVARIPLLAGESVTTHGVKVENGTAVVSFGRGQSSVEWSATLPEAPQLELTAPQHTAISEEWILQCASVVRCGYSGVTPYSTASDNEYQARWKPWPGEKLSMNFAKPTGAPGERVTLSNAELTTEYGQRLLSGSLALTVRSSTGGWESVDLGSSVSLKSAERDGATIPARLDNGKLALETIPGEHQYRIQWEQPNSMGLVTDLPAIGLSRVPSNMKVIAQLPTDRWVLWARGPAWGPVFRYWGELIFILLVAFVLTRLPIPTLRLHQWVLLGLGLSTLPLVIAAVPVLWFLAISLRRLRAPENRWAFNLLQTAIVILSAASALTLFAAVYTGLTGSPDMAVVGYGSSDRWLQWYADQTSGRLPNPSIFSLPLWVWRVLMFLWSSWLVANCLKWAVQGWEAFSSGVLWKMPIRTITTPPGSGAS